MKPFCINLKSGERIFINGAVLRVDRKVSIEFLNDVTFLLEAHVMQPEETTTPFRQLYFMIQTMVIDPSNGKHRQALIRRVMSRPVQRGVRARPTRGLNGGTAIGRREALL